LPSFDRVAELVGLAVWFRATSFVCATGLLQWFMVVFCCNGGAECGDRAMYYQEVGGGANYDSGIPTARCGRAVVLLQGESPPPGNNYASF
jgi:hypothetical protein